MTNQVKRNFLTGAGYTKALNEAEYDYLNAQLSSTGRPVPLPQRWGQYLDQEGVLSGAFNKRIREYFLSLGVAEGNINKMWSEYWTTYAGAVTNADEYWNQVQLLINADQGADGENNTVFTGATIVGSPEATSVSPFSDYDANAGSIVFPNNTSGATNYISYAGAQTGMGSNFTVEFWYYPYTVNTLYASGNYVHLIDSDQATGEATEDYWIVGQQGADIRIGSGITGSATFRASWSGVLTANQWHHLMWTGNGAVHELFVNGVSQGTQAYTDGTGTGTRPLCIGHSSVYSRYARGLISDVRLSNTVRETADFTPPTAPRTSDANTTELIQFNEAALADRSAKSLVSAIGNSQMDTDIVKYGTGSILFDGTGDYLQATVEAPGTGDFTIECWARFDSIGKGEGLFQMDATLGNVTQGPAAGYRSISPFRWAAYIGTSLNVGTNTPAANTWYHVAFSRASGVSRLFIDGVLEISNTDTTNYTDTNMFIGAWYNAANSLDGNMDDFRYTKGVARYTANFTPPTEGAGTQQAQTSGVVNISPAFQGKTTWDFDVDGDLDIGTYSATEYTITPQNTFYVDAKLWGGGGACGWLYTSSTPTSNFGPGGGGGSATGRLLLKAGTNYTLRVGEGGSALTGSSGSPARATWAAGGVPNGFYGPEGGGYSGILDGSTVVLMAGGGGGGSDTNYGANGGAGGGTNGQDGDGGSQAGSGGTQSAGGAPSPLNGATAGSYLTGGYGQSGFPHLSVGGGGGYYGGGGGNVGGGGGGSGHANSSYSDLISSTLYTGSANTPGNPSDADRNSAGDGGTLGGAGTDGRIFITKL